MADLVSHLDPSRPFDSAQEVGEKLGDELAQIFTRFADARVRPIIEHLSATYGPEVANEVLSAFAGLIRNAADGLDPYKS